MSDQVRPIETIRQQQAVMSYFAQTTVPVFKVRYLPVNRADILRFFADVRAGGDMSAKSNLGCWHTGYDSLSRWPELLEPVALQLVQVTWQCLVPQQPLSPDPTLDRIDVEMWFAEYDPDSYAQAHNHGHDALSFCWYLDVEDGGSDFVVHEHGLDVGTPVERSRTSIPVNTGDVLVFPGFLTHSVPPTPAARRVIAGNVRGIKPA